ncbi:MAG: cytochrome c biogenesis protein CcdA, partial [Planctomycetota bacterium]
MSNDTLTRAVLFVCMSLLACAAPRRAQAGSDASVGLELVRHEDEFSSARVEPVRTGEQAGIAVVFTGTHDLHYYASGETAPAAGLELKVEARSDAFDFGKAVFPNWEVITDPAGTRVEVYAGDFTVFVPITAAKPSAQTGAAKVEVGIAGIACTSVLCLAPFEKSLQASIDWTRRDSWKQIGLEAPSDTGGPANVPAAPAYSAWFALALAFVAGLGLNIMPCVWPVLPIIIMRIVDQAKTGRRQSLMMGLAFCAGILLFFASLACANIVLR